MLTPYNHMHRHEGRTDQVRKQPGSMAAIHYPAFARHADGSIWSKDHRSNWHLSAAPVHATLSRGDRPRCNPEQVRFT